ncbi:hypothetical protein [Actinomadura sp. GTD37]|uniref:hypothetical protein n=1 Tax=Actinomadura sp. GTD37 TaxID=1778030 RepID=UPI0035C0E90F
MPDPTNPLAELGDMFATARLSIAAGATIATLLNTPDEHTSREAAAQSLDGIDAGDLGRIERAAAALVDVAARLREGRPGVIAGTADSYPIGGLDA